MAKTLSNMLPLGTPAPKFALLDVLSNKICVLDENRHARATVVMFICNHCPYVKHVADELSRLALDYIPQGIDFFAINANDVTQYPDDSPENMIKTAQLHGYAFPYLYDETQEIARAYHAVCTPDFFVFDESLHLAYRGQLDDSRPGNGKAVDGRSIRQALDCLIKKAPVNEQQLPSLGCSIKWSI